MLAAQPDWAILVLKERVVCLKWHRCEIRSEFVLLTWSEHAGLVVAEDRVGLSFARRAEIASISCVLLLWATPRNALVSHLVPSFVLELDTTHHE